MSENYVFRLGPPHLISTALWSGQCLWKSLSACITAEVHSTYV